MIRTLRIKNFALIADQTIQFKKGLNVLVGETGAGKSLILDALGFVMGDKANKLNLRHGEEKMSVQAVFDDLSPQVVNLMAECDIDQDDCLIFSRHLTSEGKSECRINGTIVPVATVKQFSLLILDTYTQNENIELLKVKNHLTILDSYNPELIYDISMEIEKLLDSYINLKRQIDTIGGNSENRDRELEILLYQIHDIENANLKIGEDEELKNQIDKLSNYERIYDSVKSSNDHLTATNEMLYSVEHSLNTASKYDTSFKSILDRVVSAKIELSDIMDTLTSYQTSFEYDPKKLEMLDGRLEIIKSLKKKYGNSIEDIYYYLNKIKDKYDNLLFGEEKLKKLENELELVKSQLYVACEKLSLIRKDIAKLIEADIIHELKMLGFNNAKFLISFANLPDINNSNFSKSGLDQVEFLLSANAGEELKSLSKTISGGEMSRFMLAIKNVFAKNFGSSTLIFDEIDSGISGEIGQRVAERLAILSKNYQLICITHLCQVAAMADNYIYVKKEVEDNKTFTKVKELNGLEVVKFIASVSGASPTEVAIEFASELKKKADEFKLSISNT